MIKYGDFSAGPAFLLPGGGADEEELKKTAAALTKLTGDGRFALVRVPADDWNKDLSPWEAPPVFGNEAFGNGADALLMKIETEVIRKPGILPCRLFAGRAFCPVRGDAHGMLQRRCRRIALRLVPGLHRLSPKPSRSCKKSLSQPRGQGRADAPSRSAYGRRRDPRPVPDPSGGRERNGP